MPGETGIAGSVLPYRRGRRGGRRRRQSGAVLCWGPESAHGLAEPHSSSGRPFPLEEKTTRLVEDENAVLLLFFIVVDDDVVVVVVVVVTATAKLALNNPT